MTEKSKIPVINNIQERIYTIRGLQVMLDSDLAKMYEVDTGRLNEQVKRNIERFPEDFMFQLTNEEWKNLISQNAISSWGGRRKLPFVFTEQGISSLSGVLKSKIAVSVNIQIMRAFVQMRKFIMQNASIFQRIETIEQKQIKSDLKIDFILNAIDKKNIIPNEGIFYDGQIFDAYIFASNLIKSAKSSLILIDNYIDESVLNMFAKRNKDVKAVIYTEKISNQLQLDIEKYNKQYPVIEVKIYKKSHDRFLIIDKSEIYHIGASLKDLGKKWFAFSKINLNINEMIEKIKV